MTICIFCRSALDFTGSNGTDLRNFSVDLPETPQQGDTFASGDSYSSWLAE